MKRICHRRPVRDAVRLTTLGLVLLAGTGPIAAGAEADDAADKTFRAGACAVDITPQEFPVILNGGMSERTSSTVTDPLHARCLVLDDGDAQVAIAVVDSCLIPRALLDGVKETVQQQTGIPPERVLISSTHTHTAPSVFACLGSDCDANYARFLPVKIVEGIRRAHENLAPARIGWAVGRDEKNVACRRWLMKPGAAPTNPFGGTVDDRARMHPGFHNPDAIRPTGPVDPQVPVVAIQTRGGRPLALLSNYSMHYVGSQHISADYFGVFCRRIAELVGAGDEERFVAMLSNGTSGDAWLMDYRMDSRRQFDRFTVAEDVAQAAFAAYEQIEYHDHVPLVMRERRLTLGVRMPSAEEVERAEAAMAEFAGRKPRTVPEVYARETVLLSRMPPTRELKLQALRIGALAIVALPCEVFASTGLRIKAESPIQPTFTISMANGCEGYIAPPEQHALGGYTTWRARSSCLEREAEPKIAQAVLELLHSVAPGADSTGR